MPAAHAGFALASRGLMILKELSPV